MRRCVINVMIGVFVVVCFITGCGGNQSSDNTGQSSSYLVAFTAASHGTISGQNSQTVNLASNASAVTAIPDNGYYFVNWTEGAVVVSTASQLHITNVTSNHTYIANFATFAPAEALYKSSYFRYPTPPAGYPAVVGLMHAIDINGTGTPSKVEVDWMRLYGTVNGQTTLLYEDTFDTHTSLMDWYGLYSRNPWYAGDKLASMPFVIQNSSLIIEPSLIPNRIYHWWNTSRVLIPAGTTRVWLEAKVRITGGAGVQAGLDYWVSTSASWNGTDVNNTEAGASNWYGNSTTDWQIITIGKP